MKNIIHVSGIVSITLFFLSSYYSITELQDYNQEYDKYVRYVKSISHYDDILNELNTDNLYGRYFSQEQIIMLNASNEEVAVVQINLNHEFCHWIWYEHLDLKQTLQYEFIFNQSSHYPTEYAKTNVREDFAESCSHWLLDIDDLDSDRKNYMEKHVKPLFK